MASHWEEACPRSSWKQQNGSSGWMKPKKTSDSSISAEAFSVRVRSLTSCASPQNFVRQKHLWLGNLTGGLISGVLASWWAGYVPESIGMDINSCQVYFLVFGRPPFYSGGGPASLVAQMINFVEDLPPEWRSNWERLKSGENSSLNIRPSKHPFIFLNLPPWFAWGRWRRWRVEQFRQPRRGQLCEQPERKMPSASVAPPPSLHPQNSF